MGWEQEQGQASLLSWQHRQIQLCCKHHCVRVFSSAKAPGHKGPGQQSPAYEDHPQRACARHVWTLPWARGVEWAGSSALLSEVTLPLEQREAPHAKYLHLQKAIKWCSLCTRNCGAVGSRRGVSHQVGTDGGTALPTHIP